MNKFTMKKIVSFMMVLTMLLSIIYIPSIVAEAASVTLPDGSTMTSGMGKSTYQNDTTYTEIKTPAQFQAIKPGKKYYLGNNIDLTTLSSYTPITCYTKGTGNEGYDTADAIVLDGCGYTINTLWPLFVTLSAGSKVQNLVVTGSSITGAYYSGYTLGIVTCRTYGGYFKNIVSTADVRLNSTNGYIRVGGIIGAVLNTNHETFVENCSNSGKVLGGRDGSGNIITGTNEHRGGVGGIVGHVHTTKGTFILNCKYTRTASGDGVRNYLTAYSYAGGILGGNNAQKVVILNSTGTSHVFANTDVGTVFPNQYANRDGTTHYNLTNYHYNANAVRVAHPTDFAKLSGDTECYLAIGFIVREQNKNFTGTIYGFNRTISAYQPPFADMTKVKLENANVAVIGWTKIMNATDLAAINNRTTSTCFKYYLGASFSLPAEWTGPGANYLGYNSAPTIILDGCGYTITTTKPIFPELPGGSSGANGEHSTIRNLVVNGTVSVTAAQIDTWKKTVDEWDNGNCVAAVVGKANGGIFENITNNASVTFNDSEFARVGGIVGAAFNDAIIMRDCVNNGAITGKSAYTLRYSDTVKKDIDVYSGVAGIIAYLGYNADNSDLCSAYISECTNTGAITNTNTDATATHVLAAGIMGYEVSTKADVTIVDCVNTGKVIAKDFFGDYCSVKTRQNITILQSTPISTAEEFLAISGKRAYSLTSDLNIPSSNTNAFTGILLGKDHTVTITSGDSLFSNSAAAAARVEDVNIALNGYYINGRPLESFAVVASAENADAANLIVNRVKSKYNITLSVKTPANNYKGNAIFINQGNTYGGVRSGLDYGVNSDGYMEVYVERDSVTSFINNCLTVSATSADFYSNFGAKGFTYNFTTGGSQGITYNQANDVKRTLADGVTYIERTYTTASGGTLEAYMIILESDAKAHFEMYAAPLTSINDCSNSANCNNRHVLDSDRKTTSDFAEELEKNGKDVIAATNASFFMLSAKCYTPWGMQIVNGTVNRAPWSGGGELGNTWFGVTKDGTPVISDFEGYTNTYQGQIYNGVGGRELIIRDGAYVAQTKTGHDARTAVGYNADGDIVILTVSGNDNHDGTAGTNPGASLADLAQMFMDLDIDITHALNLDGGGSTAMVAEDENGDLALKTYQYSGTPVGEERALIDGMVIVAD